MRKVLTEANWICPQPALSLVCSPRTDISKLVYISISLGNEVFFYVIIYNVTPARDECARNRSPLETCSKRFCYIYIF